MRKIKHILPFVVMLLAVATTLAFTPAKQARVDGELWYTFTGDQFDDPDNAANYELYGNGSTAPGCAEASEIRCAVKALPGANSGALPDMDHVTEFKDTFIP